MTPPVDWERRRVPRFSVEELVTLKLLEGNGEVVTGTCRDVSVGGMFCQIPAPVPAGRTLEFTLNLPSDTMLAQPVRLRGHGKVVRVSPVDPKAFGVAISFSAAEVLPNS